LHESILELAGQIVSASEAEAGLLEALCLAAEESWTLRLRPGLTPEQCGGAFLCAAAFTAAAGLAATRDSGGVSFKAGDVSVTEASGGGGSSARALREQAEQMMAPYTAADDFAFRGVRS